jgi:hypothetical protein
MPLYVTMQCKNTAIFKLFYKMHQNNFFKKLFFILTY